MRAVEYVVEYMALPRAFAVLSGMDDFAALAGGPAADPAIGGFRIVRPRSGLPPRVRARAMRRLARARQHVTGSLSLLFILGLALAILAGPSSCLCGLQQADAASLEMKGDATLLSRFAYTRASAIGSPSATHKGGTLPKLAALVEPHEPAGTIGTSPISTAAITPLSEARASTTRPAPLGVLPTKIETLADAAPKPIRLAAAAPAEDSLIPMLPMVEIATPEAPETVTVETETKPATHREAHHRRAFAHRHAHNSRRASSYSSPKIVRAPRWAKQMFETPWQSSAFSYIR
jgi:hypothetical protein